MYKESEIEIIKDLISFNTVTEKSNKSLIGYVCDYLDKHEVSYKILDDKDGKSSNLVASIGPTDKPGIVFSGHTDVVTAEGQDWKSPPFEPVIRDGKLYGRGACDMKGALGCLLANVEFFKSQKLSVPIHIALSCDEETIPTGVHDIIRYFKDTFPMPYAAVICEPTECRIADVHKGVTAFDVAIKGVACHSSRPDLGENAIVVAAKIISFLEDLSEDIRRNDAGYSRFMPPYSTISFGQINGGVAVNTVAEDCRFSWHIRQIEHKHVTAVREKLADFINNHVYPRYPSIRITENCFELPALEYQSFNPARELMTKATGLNECVTFSGGTEAGFFQRAGIPAVVCGPGDISMAHKADEYVEVIQIEQFSALIKNIVKTASADVPS